MKDIHIMLVDDEPSILDLTERYLEKMGFLNITPCLGGQVALEKQPDHGGSLAGLGHALKTIGRQDEAVATYRDCIQAYPGFGEAYWSLANLKTFRFTDAEVATMEKHVDDEKLLEETRICFNCALGKAHEDRQDYDRAFAYYEHGNSMRRMNESYDPVQTEVIHDRIIETITPEFLKDNAGNGDPDSSPIFIVGLPRSGSTLIEQILAPAGSPVPRPRGSP